MSLGMSRYVCFITLTLVCFNFNFPSSIQSSIQPRINQHQVNSSLSNPNCQDKLALFNYLKSRNAMNLVLTFRRPLRTLGKSNPNLSSSIQARTISNLVKCDFVNADKKVAILTLNDPDRLNALTEPMGDELGARVQDLKQV